MTALDLDARVAARLAALTHRAGLPLGAPDDLGGLGRLFDLARHLGQHDLLDGHAELLAARRECEAFLRDALRDLGPADVRSEHAASRVQLDGDARTALAPDITPEAARAHALAVAAALAAAARRLRLLAAVTTAAAAIAALITAPGAGLVALPIAYRCVRDVYDPPRAPGPDNHERETAWRTTT